MPFESITAATLLASITAELPASSPRLRQRDKVLQTYKHMNSLPDGPEKDRLWNLFLNQAVQYGPQGESGPSGNPHPANPGGHHGSLVRLHLRT
jgi:hypothetical protein